MNIKEIYEKFDKVGSLTFSTWNGQEIQSRIAHFFAYDEDGLYFRTMAVKPFYNQLVKYKAVSVCGIYPKSQIEHDENNLPKFEPGYTMRISGKAKELSLEDVEKKAKNDENFNVAVHDIKKYPMTRIFLLEDGFGELYDYDFPRKNRSHKLLRTAFSYGNAEADVAGMNITENCIECGACFKVCTFDAIKEGSPYSVIGERCDECGNCVLACPANAIKLRGNVDFTK